jgi:hypothetical protein
MKDGGAFSVMGSNNFAVSPQQNFTRWINKRGFMCWKCQKDKPRQGGSEKMMGKGIEGIRRFICKDCVEAKQRSIAACQDPNRLNP